MNGESLEIRWKVDDDPMWIDSTILRSLAARNTGSQWPVWMVGRPSGSKFSEKQIERQPLAYTRSISVTASAGSHRGMMASGIRRPGSVPHHSSIIQSL